MITFTNMLCLDPGLTTGYAIFGLGAEQPLTLIECGQITGGLEGVVRFIMENEIDTFEHLVSESFVLDGRTPKPEVEPLRIEGALKALAALAHAPAPVFQRNIYKRHAPDELLKRAELYQRGKPHANDAIRHGIAWAKTHGHLPTIKWLWPPIAG